MPETTFHIPSLLNRDDAGRVAEFRGVHGPSASAIIAWPSAMKTARW